MRGVVCGVTSPGVAFPAYDSQDFEPHGIVFTTGRTHSEVFLFIRTPIFSISSIAMGNNFTTRHSRFIRLPISHVPPSESVDIIVCYGFSSPHRGKEPVKHMNRNMSRMARWRLYLGSIWIILCSSSSERKSTSCIRAYTPGEYERTNPYPAFFTHYASATSR